MAISLVKAELKFAVLALIAGALLGYITGYWLTCVTLSLLVFIAWLLLQLSRLHQWLKSGAPIENAPEAAGSARHIINLICAIKNENTKQQANLEELISRFDAATGAMPDAMLIVNDNQNIEWANPAAQKLLGIDASRDIGQRIDNIVRDPEITRYLHAANYSQPLEFASPGSGENNRMLRIIPYGEGRRLLCVHDHQDLLRLQKVRKAFIANASHEMRTPLTVIIGYLEALTLREETEPATKRGIEGALEQAHRLKQLIEDLLSLSRLESLPLIKSQMQQVELGMLVHESIELIKSSAVYFDHQFELSINHDLRIKGDNRELQSAVQNVIENAVKYSAGNTLIKVIVELTQSGDARLVVKDQGEGIEQKHIARLAERFYRVDKGRSRDKGGTGLGLSIVKHIMERHDGELIISSVIGEGTQVELFFPKDRTVNSLQRISA